MNSDDDDFEASENSSSEYVSENSANQTGNEVSDSDQAVAIAAKENRAVSWSRGLVIVVLLVVAAVAGAMTYVFTGKTEQIEFENDVSFVLLFCFSLSLY